MSGSETVTTGRCTLCGFDPTEWTEQDMTRTLDHVETLLGLWSEGVAPDVAEEVDGLADSVRARIDPVDDLAEQVHVLWHGLVAIADLRRGRGDVPVRGEGAVAQINRSGGGVPKLPVDRAEVDRHGVVGDVQAARIHHGRPWQALCLWSADVIDEIAAEGNPIHAGAAGENVTIVGIDWAALRAGSIIDVGSVRCQLTAPAVPCTKNSRWFTDGAIDRMDHDVHPGSSRWYASVLTPGSIATGDPVVLEPEV